MCYFLAASITFTTKAAKANIVTYPYPRSLWKGLAFLVPNGMPSGIWELLTIPVVVALFIAWLAPGTIGPNRYGPDPREDAPVPAWLLSEN